MASASALVVATTSLRLAFTSTWQAHNGKAVIWHAVQPVRVMTATTQHSITVSYATVSYALYSCMEGSR